MLNSVQPRAVRRECVLLMIENYDEKVCTNWWSVSSSRRLSATGQNTLNVSLSLSGAFGRMAIHFWSELPQIAVVCVACQAHNTIVLRTRKCYSLRIFLRNIFAEEFLRKRTICWVGKVCHPALRWRNDRTTRLLFCTLLIGRFSLVRKTLNA